MPPRVDHKIENGIETKRRGVCETYKELSQYHRVNNTWDGLFYACKECWQAARASNTRKRAVEKYNGLCRRVSEDERYIKRGVQVRVSLVDFVDWYKRSYIRGGCVDRKNNEGHYELGNMQIITQAEHNLKRRSDRLERISVVETPGTRYCFDCATLKQESDFYQTSITPTASNPNSLKECCKDCAKEKRRKHYSESKLK
jgi:hypothetical protein